MSFDPLGLAFPFVAGIFALFSPCGFPMLPGYVSYYMGARVPLERAVKSGFVCLSGLLVVFSSIGVVASVSGSIISQYVSFLEPIAGLITMSMGLSMIISIKSPVLLPSLRAPKSVSLTGIFLYGSLYGLATLGCSAPIFLSILFYAITMKGLLYGMIVFVVYAIGMGVPLIITTILVAKAKNLILKRKVKATWLLQKLSGVILLSVGAYLILYYFIAFHLT